MPDRQGVAMIVRFPSSEFQPDGQPWQVVARTIRVGDEQNERAGHRGWWFGWWLMS